MLYKNCEVWVFKSLKALESKCSLLTYTFDLEDAVFSKCHVIKPLTKFDNPVTIPCRVMMPWSRAPYHVICDYV